MRIIITITSQNLMFGGDNIGNRCDDKKLFRRKWNFSDIS